MKLGIVAFVVCFSTLLTPPTDAFLGAKLSLLGLDGGGGGGGSYGSGNYNGGYYGPKNRPVYSSNGYGYGYAQQSSGAGSGYTSAPRGGYGGNYNVGYNNGGYGSSGYRGGNYGSGEQIIKVIKVIIPNENAGYSSNYANGYANGYSSGWTPIQASAPTPGNIKTPPPLGPVQVPVQTSYAPVPEPRPIEPFAPQPFQYSAQIKQVGIPQEYQQYRAATSQSIPVQYSVQTAPQLAPARVDSTPTINLPAPLVAPQISVALQPPQPQTLPQPAPAPYQPVQVVKTIKVIVDGNAGNRGGLGYNGLPSHTYGPLASGSSSGYAQNSNGGAWGGDGWSNGYKSGGIWEKVGC